MYFWLNYADGNNHFERIPVAVKDIDHPFLMASEILEFDTLHLFVLSDGTRIDDDKYLESLESAAELIISIERNRSKYCQAILT